MNLYFLKSATKRTSARLTALLFLAVAVFVSGCAVQESNTYPIEIFSEMHYSQAPRSQEPQRLQPPAEAVPFQQIGTGQVLEVPDFKERPYDPAVARELFRVNCSVCHGDTGVGDGPAAQHIISSRSYYATTNDEPYAAPANLHDKRETYDKDAMINIITNGIVVMPRFGKLLSEEDIRDIATFIYDEETGLGR